MDTSFVSANSKYEALIWLALGAIWFVAQIVAKFNQAKKGDTPPPQPGETPTKRPSGLDGELRKFLDQLSGQMEEEEPEEPVRAAPTPVPAPAPPPVRRAPPVPEPVPTVMPTPVVHTPRQPAQVATVAQPALVAEPANLVADIEYPMMPTTADHSLSTFLSTGNSRSSHRLNLPTLGLGVMRPSASDHTVSLPALNQQEALKQALRARFILDPPRALSLHPDPSR